MKKLLILAAVAALSACGGGGGGQDDGPPDCSATLWGDSIAKRMIGKIQGFDVVNKAVSATSAQGRMSEFLEDPVTTRFTIIQWGMNDLATNTTALEHADRLRKMVQHVRQRGGIAVITGISGSVDYHEEKRIEFNTAVRDLASFVDWGALPYARDEVPDKLHPAPAYEARLVAALTEHLRTLAPECK